MYNEMMKSTIESSFDGSIGGQATIRGLQLDRLLLWRRRRGTSERHVKIAGLIDGTLRKPCKIH